MFEVLNPISHNGWDDSLIKFDNDYLFFHTSGWAKALQETYNYKPIYFCKFSDGALTCLFPLMELRSRLTGFRAVSLPFTDYCTPILNKCTFKEMFEHIVKYGLGRGWKCIDLKVPLSTIDPDTPHIVSYRHIINIDRSLDSVLANTSSSNRRNIRKATKENVQIEFSDSHDSMLKFYELNCITRRMHGIPPQPLHFFKNVFKNIIDQGRGIIVKAKLEEKVIAANVYFHFHKKALYKYGASDYKYQNLRANNLIMWKAIEWYHEKGFTELCLGRTEQSNTGLRRFKLAWGSEEEIIANCRFDLNKKKFVAYSRKASRLHTSIFQRMPIPLLKGMGKILYRHMG